MQFAFRGLSVGGIIGARDAVASASASTPATDIRKPSLPALAHVLRHPETWPEGFKWDNAFYDKSAIGLLVKKWGGPGFNADNELYQRHYAVMLKTTPEIVRKLFLSPLHAPHRLFGLPIFPRSARFVTPEMVAQEIERHLATQP